MTITELLIAAVIAAGLIATLFGIADPLQGLFDAQLELAEMHQRLRTGVHAIEQRLVGGGTTHHAVSRGSEAVRSIPGHLLSR